MRTRTAVLASLLIGAAFAASAQSVFHHPAVPTPLQIAGVDPSTFLVGHPASPTWQLRHANTDHPAIAMLRESKHSPIDPNTFIVQPPAHAEWTHPGAVGTEETVAAVHIR